MRNAGYKVLQQCIELSRPLLGLLPKDFKTGVKKLIRYNINSADYWDKIWEQEGENTWRDFSNKYQYIISLVPDNTRVLDIGCGVGLLLRKLKEARPGIEGTGADISAQAVAFVKKHGFSGVVGGFPTLDLPSGTFDVILATEVLEHLSKPEQAVAEVIRLMKPDGQAILTVPDDCLGPDVEVQHLWQFNRESFGALLTPHFEKVELTSIPDLNYNFLVAVCSGPRPG